MDLLRSCYQSEMRLYSDRPDIAVPGSWHFAPPGAKFLPFATSFGSSRWDDYRVRDDFPLGELRDNGRYARGKPDPRFVGDHFCGSPAAWLDGIPYADRPGLALGTEGIPLCCLPAGSQAVPIAGGLVINGRIEAAAPIVGRLIITGRIEAAAPIAGGLVVAGRIDAAAPIAGGLVVAGLVDAAAPIAGGLSLGGDTAAMPAIAGGLSLGGDTAGMLAIAGGLPLGGDTGPFVGPAVSLRMGVSADVVTANNFLTPTVGADTFVISGEALDAIGNVATSFSGGWFLDNSVFDNFVLIDPAGLPSFNAPVLDLVAGTGTIGGQWVYVGIQGTTNVTIIAVGSSIGGSVTQTVSML